MAFEEGDGVESLEASFKFEFLISNVNVKGRMMNFTKPI